MDNKKIMYDNSNFVNEIKPFLSSYHSKQFFLRDDGENTGVNVDPVSYTHLRAHET